MSNINQRIVANNTKIEQLKTIAQNLPEAAKPIYASGSYKSTTVSESSPSSSTTYECVTHNNKLYVLERITSTPKYIRIYEIDENGNKTKLFEDSTNVSGYGNYSALFGVDDEYVYFYYYFTSSSSSAQYDLYECRKLKISDKTITRYSIPNAPRANYWQSQVYTFGHSSRKICVYNSNFNYALGTFNEDFTGFTNIKSSLGFRSSSAVYFLSENYIAYTANIDEPRGPAVYNYASGLAYKRDTYFVDESEQVTLLSDGKLYYLNSDGSLGEYIKDCNLNITCILQWIGGSYYNGVASKKIYKYNSTSMTFEEVYTVSSDYTRGGSSYFYNNSLYTFVIEPKDDISTVIGYSLNGKQYYPSARPAFNSGSILNGTQVYSSEGSAIIGTMPDNGAINITPSTSSQSIPTGYTSGGTVAAVTAAIDSNIVAENIREGVEILGVEGTVQEGAQGVVLYSSTAEMEEDTSQDEGTYGVVAGTNFEGVYKYTDSAWVIVGDPVEALVAFNELAEVLGDSSEEYEGLGGTEAEIVEILEDVVGEEGGNE